MDVDAIRAIEADLVAWGLLERDEALRPTRRFRGALARAAMELQEAEKAGRAPPGNPVENVVASALRDFPLPEGAVAGDRHRAFLVAVQVASLPEAARGLLGL